MGSSTCGLQLNGSAAAATPAKSDNPNDVVLTMKKVALSYISPNGTSVVDSSATSFSSFRRTIFYEISSFLAAYVDWIDGFIRFNGIRIVTKWASALCAGVIPNCKHYPTIDASALEALKN